MRCDNCGIPIDPEKSNNPCPWCGSQARFVVLVVNEKEEINENVQKTSFLEYFMQNPNLLAISVSVSFTSFILCLYVYEYINEFLGCLIGIVGVGFSLFYPYRKYKLKLDI